MIKKTTLSAKELAQRVIAVRQANANVFLEGFVLDPEVVDLNRRFACGEISLDVKLKLLKKLYGSR